MGSAFQLLASGYHALNRLNREEVDLVLSLVTAEAADVAGLWSLWTGLSALRGAVWGNPSESLNRLLAEISNRPAMVNELDEPLGRMVLGRARVLLLAKTGAIAAAKAAIEEMPPGLRPVPMARTALWAGQANEALRHAEAGLLQTGVRPADRPRLAVIAAAASLLAGTATKEAQERATRALDDLFATRGLWPLAALPASARHPLLVLYGAQHSVDEATFSELTGLLADLNDAESVSRAVRLTHRERQLLPLLATDDSIPEIAKTLQVSVHTVRTQVATLREKFHAATRAELIRQASLLGAIPPQPPDTRGR
jgi:DNA-binding CsgD family transcriptional regulator